MGLATLRRDELAEKCRDRGLPDHGSKSELLAIIRADERAQQHLAALHLQYSRENPPSIEQDLEIEAALDYGEIELEPEEKYPPLSPLHNPQYIFQRLEIADLQKICEQNDTNEGDASIQDWNCLSVQAKYRDKAEAALLRRDERLKQAMKEILGEYASEMEAAKGGLEREMGRFGEGNMEFARKKMNWTYANEELEVSLLTSVMRYLTDCRRPGRLPQKLKLLNFPELKLLQLNTKRRML